MDPAPEEFALSATTAPADVQLQLLALQALDTRLLQVDHKLATLPEHAALRELDTRELQLRDRVVAAQTEVGDLERAVAKAESDVEQVRTRIARDQQLLDSGSVGSARQLQDIQSELGSLARRQGELEEVELEVLQRVEDAASALQGLLAEQAALAGERATLQAGLGEQTGTLAAERAELATDRAAQVVMIPADLLALYERLRADLGGVGAAALHRGRCEGCRMQINASELGAIRAAPADAIVRCEECRRILVRTPESGL